MLSISVFRNAALISAKRTTTMSAIAAPLRRTYATENGGKEESPKEGEPAAAAGEALKVEVELTEEVKAMLAEKDKKIKELQVKYWAQKEEKIEKRLYAAWVVAEKGQRKVVRDRRKLTKL